MDHQRRLSIAAGIMYLVTFVTSIPALALKEPFLRDNAPALLAQWASLLEILLALACVGTAIAMYPIGKQYSPALALGFVGSRLIEAATVFVGVIALLGVVAVRGSAAGGGGSAETALIAMHDWAFLTGPGILPVVNALMFATLLYRHRLVPRVIPLVGLIGAPLLAISSIGTLFGVVDQVSTLAGLAALPIALWEFSIGVWLIAKGVALRPNPALEPVT